MSGVCEALAVVEQVEHLLGAGLKAHISRTQNFMQGPCTWVSSDFDNTWSADRGQPKITREVCLAALAALTGGKTGCQSGKNSFFGKS